MILIPCCLAHCCANCFSYALATGKNGNRRCAALLTASNTPKRCITNVTSGVGGAGVGVGNTPVCSLNSIKQPDANVVPGMGFIEVTVSSLVTAGTVFCRLYKSRVAASHTGSPE